jgi:hypothetical protein
MYVYMYVYTCMYVDTFGRTIESNESINKIILLSSSIIKKPLTLFSFGRVGGNLVDEQQPVHRG